MEIEKNNKIATEELLDFIKRRIFCLEDLMAEKFNAKIYRTLNGFTQEEIYEYAGAQDSVVNLKLSKELSCIYGDSLTVVFVYSQKERITLEKNKAALNDMSNIKTKELLGDINSTLYNKLLEDGIPIKEIVEMIVYQVTEENNTFTSALLRKPKILEIPFESIGDSNDIFVTYNDLSRFISDSVKLSPEEYNNYLACKLILNPNDLIEREKAKVFDKSGKIVNQEVGYLWLMWKKRLGRLTEKNKADLEKLSLNRLTNRLALADKELQNMGLSFDKLLKKYPEKASFLFLKILNFRECRYNLVGKHLLYMSYESFLHIYLRHVKELSFFNQFSERSKFQLEEKDLKITMNIVLHALNNKYQEYKDKNPNNRFFCKGSMAYYCNGDYYDVDILPDGQIGTFYKRIDK